MTPRMNENLFKVLFVVLIFVVLLFHSMFSEAQIYKGFDISFGSRQFMIDSEIAKLDEVKTVVAGGRIGFIFGTSTLRTSAGAGYYSSTSGTPGTIDQYQAGAKVSLYPLALIDKEPRVQPYLTAGISLDELKFYGYYVDREPGVTNYSQAEAPYLGSIRQANARFGAGIEISIIQNYDFVHLYSEVYYGHNLSQKTEDAVLNNTSLTSTMRLNIGVVFGICR